MKYFRNLIVYLITMIVLSGCTVDWRGPHSDGPSGPTVYTEYPDTSYVEVEITTDYYYDDACWEEDPYWRPEEWCDYYDDGSMCCVWYVDGWYEEWCQWDYDWCWEYNGSF